MSRLTGTDALGLFEAYQAVYNPQELTEEGIRSAVKRLLGGGKKETEAPKPMSRGEVLRQRYNVGPEGSDTSAKMQIINRSRARAERDKKEYGDSKYSKSVPQKSQAALDRYLKAGYSKYGADDARGSGNRARRRAAALNQEDFKYIVDSLIEEGYDLSTYTVDEFYDICLDEAQGYDLYDVVLSHLLDEGYANTQESALVIMSNMSEAWVESIVEANAAETKYIGSGPETAAGRSGMRNRISGKSSEERTGAHILGRGVKKGEKTGPEGYMKYIERTEGQRTKGQR